MLSEASDFEAECDALAGILENCDEAGFDKVTLFKSWTVRDVIAHLHYWNLAASMTLNEPDRFAVFMQKAAKQLLAGQGQRELHNAHFGNMKSRKIFEQWRNFYPELSNDYSEVDPERRIAWAGPDMSARAAIIARQMETWAHGQEIFDVFGLERYDTDRIRNIAHLGVMTYSWSFQVRGKEPLLPKPFVQLMAPSGEIWEWNDRQSDNRVEGSATGFCQIVTQTRNHADTDIVTTGETAQIWIENAQCFAGPPEKPPAPGARHRT